MHVYPDDWKEFPVPDVCPKMQQPIVDLVEAILAVKRADANADVTDKEVQLDRLVRTLYGFE